MAEREVNMSQVLKINETELDTVPKDDDEDPKLHIEPTEIVDKMQK